MIIHLMYDEKFCDTTITNFEKVNKGKNRYIIFRTSTAIPYTYITLTEYVTDFSIHEDDLNEIINGYTHVSGIIMHSLSTDFARCLRKITKDIDLCWMVWGYDLYSLPEIRPTLYAPHTLRYLFLTMPLTLVNIWVRKNEFIRSIYYLLLRKDDPYKLQNIIHRKIKYFTSYIREDFDIFKKYYPNTACEFIDSTFFDINQYVTDEFINSKVNGNNILIGNSNSYESNHLDVLDFLSKITEVGNRNIYVPLSYGEDIKYRDTIIKSGKKKWPKSFKPQLKFIPRNEYVEILLSCGTGIFYHYRQQAMGNIIAMLWLGARIYMSDKNPAYNFLKRIGLHVFILESNFHIYKFTPLNDSEIETNRKILWDKFSPQKVEDDLTNLINCINKSKRIT